MSVFSRYLRTPWPVIVLAFTIPAGLWLWQAATGSWSVLGILGFSLDIVLILRALMLPIARCVITRRKVKKR